MGRIISFVLIIGIIFCVTYIYFLFKRFFFVKQSYNSPSLTQRTFAFLLDFGLVNFAFITIGTVYLYFSGEMHETVNGYVKMVKHQGTQRFYYDWRFVEFYLLVTTLFLSFVSELLFKTTLGKKAIGLKVSGETGIGHLLVRNSIKLLSVLLAPILFLFSRTNKKGKWLHDILSKTEITHSV